jgi:hypothetical protein
MAALCREFGISRKLRAMRIGRVKWPSSSALPLRQPVTRAGRGGHRERQTREASLGRAQNPRASLAAPARMPSRLQLLRPFTLY